MTDKSVWRISEDERSLLPENDMEMLDEAELDEPLVLEQLELELLSSSSALCKGNKLCSLKRAWFTSELAALLSMFMVGGRWQMR